MLRRVRPMIRYGGAVCIALGLATGPARAEAGTTAPQIELVISAVADPDASGAAYVELRLLNSGSASETMTLPPPLRSEEHTSELPSLMSHSCAVLRLKTHHH